MRNALAKALISDSEHDRSRFWVFHGFAVLVLRLPNMADNGGLRAFL